MVEYDIVRYLGEDATLDTLLGVIASDEKIYPDKPPTEATLPYILYYESINPPDEILDVDRIQLTIRASTKLAATNIRDRLKILLDKEDKIQQTTLTTGSTTYHIYYCKLDGGSRFWEPVTEIWNQVMFFLVKYRKKD